MFCRTVLFYFFSAGKALSFQAGGTCAKIIISIAGLTSHVSTTPLGAVWTGTAVTEQYATCSHSALLKDWVLSRHELRGRCASDLKYLTFSTCSSDMLSRCLCEVVLLSCISLLVSKLALLVSIDLALFVF